MFFTFREFLLACTAVAALAVSGPAGAAAAENSPAGLWKTFDDRTHNARGTVLIYEENGAFFGKIESSFNPSELNEHCHNCQGDRNNAPLIGLVIMRGMTKHGSEFDGGDILDPETGTVYRCKFTLSSDGARLMMRGYLGISLLGRTQTWRRIDSSAFATPPVTSASSLASIGSESAK
jgi:uncharacterized protein (DUF2147 family)